MTEKKKNQKPSVEEALKPRISEDQMKEIKKAASDMNQEKKLRDEVNHLPILEQTQDEILQQAMSEASLEDRLKIGSPMEEPTMVIQNNKPVTIPPISPVSNTAPQHPVTISSQGSVEMTKPVPSEAVLMQEDKPEEKDMEKDEPAEEKELEALKGFIKSDSFNVSTVGHMINTICSQPRGLPYVHTWVVPKGCDIPLYVYTIVTTDGYVDALWPCLKMVMGTNIGNAFWTASVAVSAALNDAIRFLPVVESMGDLLGLFEEKGNENKI